MSKEIVESNAKNLAIAAKYGAVGAVENVGQDDIELKRLKLGQGTSDIVQEGKVSVGQYYNSQDASVVGSNEEPAEFVIVYMDKMWMEFDMVYDSAEDEEVKKFKQVLPFGPETQNLPYKEEGIVRDLSYNFYMLSTKELADGACIPYIFSLSRVQTKAAKNINSKLSEMAANGMPSFAYTFQFTSESKQKGEGKDIKKWAQVAANISRVATEAEMEEAFRWLNLLKAKQGDVKVAGEDKPADKPTGSKKETVEEDDIPF